MSNNSQEIITLKDYPDKKARGLTTLKSLDGNNFVVISKRFNPETGDEEPPQRADLHMHQLDAQIKHLEDQLAVLKLFRADLMALVESES